MIPPPPGSGPLDLNVNMARNRDIITPLSLGQITYTDPSVLQTTQITEILVLDAAIPFQRFAATAPFNLTGNSAAYPKLSEVFNGDDFEDNHAAGGYNKSSPRYQGESNTDGNWLQYPGVQQLEGTVVGEVASFDLWKDMWDRRASLKENSSLAGVWLDAQRNKVTADWASKSSLAFSPQIDVFSRYNKWFTSVTWMVPDNYGGPSSFTWPVLFIYADRQNKVLYNTPGTISAASSGGSEGGGDDESSITITSASGNRSGNIASIQVTWTTSQVFDFYFVYLNDVYIATTTETEFSQTAVLRTDQSIPRWVPPLQYAPRDLLKFKVVGTVSSTSEEQSSGVFSVLKG